MKKVRLVIVLSFIAITLNAGNDFFGWLHFTPKAGFGNSVMINKSASDFDDVFVRFFNGSYMYGGQFGVTFVDMFDLSFEINKNVANQLYSISNDLIKYDKSYKFTNVDYGVVFKYMGSTGYFELGVLSTHIQEIDIKNNVKEDASGNDPDFIENTDYFNSQHLSVIAGFGATLVQVDVFEITMGLRFKYSIDPYAKGPELPLLDNYYTGTFSENSETRNFSAMLELDIHNFFGFFGRSICGGRALMLFGKPKIKWN